MQLKLEFSIGECIQEMINKDIYAVRLKDNERLFKSSSGGMFWALAETFVSRGDAVACTVYNNITKQAEIQLIIDKMQLDTAQGSKYMQSIAGDSFHTCVTWLEQHRNHKLLFVGTGCQAAGFRKFIERKKMRERVLIVDLICHGSPSPKLWREYAYMLEKKYHGNIEFVSFKDKRNGWNTPYAYVKIQQKEIQVSDYVNLFYSGCILRPACYCCPYATVERTTDLTIGDFWGIEKVMPDFFNKNGTSLVLVHTELGIQLFHEIEEKLDVRESTINECLQPNLIAPTSQSEQRGWFWKMYTSHGLMYAMHKLFQPSFPWRIKRFVHQQLAMPLRQLFDKLFTSYLNP